MYRQPVLAGFLDDLQKISAAVAQGAGSASSITSDISQGSQAAQQLALQGQQLTRTVDIAAAAVVFVSVFFVAKAMREK